MVSNKPHGRSRKCRHWEIKRNILHNRIIRLHKAIFKESALEEIPIEDEGSWINFNNLALVEEYYQEPPFNATVRLTSHITLREFIRKWCLFEHSNVTAEANKIYHTLRRKDSLNIALPYPVRKQNKKRGHVLYRESDLYFAWRHYQRILHKLHLPDLKPYGEIIWKVGEKVKGEDSMYRCKPIIHYF